MSIDLLAVFVWLFGCFCLVVLLAYLGSIHHCIAIVLNLFAVIVLTVVVCGIVLFVVGRGVT